VDILITEKGLQILNDLQVHMEGFNTQVINLTEEEVVIMNDLLDKLRG